MKICKQTQPAQPAEYPAVVGGDVVQLLPWSGDTELPKNINEYWLVAVISGCKKLVSLESGRPWDWSATSLWGGTPAYRWKKVTTCLTIEAALDSPSVLKKAKQS